MNYREFKNKVQHLPLVLSRDLVRFRKDKQSIRNQLCRWQKKALIIKLKKGIYILNEGDRKITPCRQFIANQLCVPSYISMEFALNFYGLIPERVTVVTSVTTRKTAQFTNELGDFVYQRIKPAAFRGFKSVKADGGLDFFIAVPEKAIVDFLYLNSSAFKGDAHIFESSYRFQNIEELSIEKIKEFAKLFGNNKLNRVAGLFCDYLKEERGE